MRPSDFLKRLEGTQTISSVMALISVDKDKAAYLIYRLRKEGYVKTRKRGDQTRVYDISFKNKLNGVSYYDIINQGSPTKVSAPSNNILFGKKPTAEEALVFAVNTKSLRTIIAALSLFHRINDWSMLYRLSKKDNIQREIAALYDLARTIVKKIKRMPKRFQTFAKPKKGSDYEFIIQGLRSKDFQNIEKRWKVYLPFNQKDLEADHDIH